jgi:hypothetical protein
MLEVGVRMEMWVSREQRGEYWERGEHPLDAKHDGKQHS